MKNERRKMKVMKRSRKSEQTLTSCMDEMRQTLGPWAMRCVQGMSVTTQDYEDYQLRAHSRVTQMCHVIAGFHVLRVDLGFHVVTGVGRLTVQQDGFIRQLHFTTHTQHQVQSSFLYVVVRLCPVIVNSICSPNSCIFHIAKTGLLRCCLCTHRRLQ